MSTYCADQQCGLYRCFDDELRLLYAGVSLNVAARNARHREKSWITEVSDIKVEWFSNGKRALKAERRAIRVENPKYNVRSKGSFANKAEWFDDRPPDRSEVISIWTGLQMDAVRNPGSAGLDINELSYVSSIPYFDVLAIMNYLCEAEFAKRLKHGRCCIRYRIRDQSFKPIRDLGLTWQLGDRLCD